MLLSAVIEAMSDDVTDFAHSSPPVRELVCAAEAMLAQHGTHTLVSLLTAGLERLLQMPSDAIEDLVLLPLRALQTLVGGLADHGSPDGTPLAAAALPEARMLELERSRAVEVALEAARAHPDSWRVHSSLVGLLSCLVGTDSTVGDALVAAGVLVPLVHTIRTFASMESLAERSTALLEGLTRTDAGRRAARELGALDALGVLLSQWPDDANLQREVKILSAVIACGSDGLDAVLGQLGLTQGLPGDESSAAARPIELPCDAAAAEQVLAHVELDAAASTARPHPPGGQRIAWGSGDCAGVATYWY